MSDKLTVDILSDGTVKVTTDPVSPANHANAEALLRDIARGCGGETSRTRRPNAIGHVHSHEGHVHSH